MDSTQLKIWGTLPLIMHAWLEELSQWPGGIFIQQTAEFIFKQWDVWYQMPVRLQIIFMSVWWNKWGIHLLYAAFFIAAAWWFYRIQLKRKLAEQEALRLKELDEMKSQLYANITHEFRTPLMLILGQVDQCLRQHQNDGNPQQIKKLKSVKYNGQRLLQLVNQILDLRKMEGGKMTVNLKYGDIIPLFRFIIESFQSMAFSREIELVFETKTPSLMMNYDSDKIFKIVTNLLANALKFTQAGGRVVFFVQKFNGEVEFQIKDNGEGISAKELPHIFSRFYQAKSKFNNSGTGIGLTLVKELVELLGGKISVNSIQHIGTSFVVRLPVTEEKAAEVLPDENNGQHAFDEFDLQTFAAGLNQFPIEDHEIESIHDEKLPLILLVEDNREVASFIASMLRYDYHLVYAENGEKGIERALELVPDLIISDVMMPGKNGFELLSALKGDQRSSHIPIILLTAKVDAEDRLEGFRRGADAYLDKPFQEEELLVRVRQLLSLRKILLQRYARLEVPAEDLEQPSKLVPEFDLPMEDRFLRMVISEIRDNYTDPDFGPSKLCQSLMMSSSQLHRKLTAITDKTPVQLIRSLRLAKAKELLKNHSTSISNVAYDSGFKDPAYFSRIFSKEFGVSPSEYKEQGLGDLLKS